MIAGLFTPNMDNINIIVLKSTFVHKFDPLRGKTSGVTGVIHEGKKCVSNGGLDEGKRIYEWGTE